MLFKTLNVDMKDVKPSQLLGGRERDFENNPDFSNKDLSSQQPLAPPGSVRVPAAVPLQPLELASEQPPSMSSLPHTPKAPQVIIVALAFYLFIQHMAWSGFVVVSSFGLTLFGVDDDSIFSLLEY